MLALEATDEALLLRSDAVRAAMYAARIPFIDELRTGAAARLLAPKLVRVSDSAAFARIVARRGARVGSRAGVYRAAITAEARGAPGLAAALRGAPPFVFCKEVRRCSTGLREVLLHLLAADGNEARVAPVVAVVVVDRFCRRAEAAPQLRDLDDGFSMLGPRRQVLIITEDSGRDLHRVFGPGLDVRAAYAGGLVGPEYGVRALLADMVAAVQSVHARGVIHFDVKPENFVLACTPDAACAPRLRLIDFGGAQFVDARRHPPGAPRGVRRLAAAISAARPAAFTYNYAAPETVQASCFDPFGAEGLQCDFRADVYSLGLTIGALLAKTSTYTVVGARVTHTQILRRQLSARLAENLKSLGPAFFDYVDRFTRLKPADRATLDELSAPPAPDELRAPPAPDSRPSDSLAAEDEGEELPINEELSILTTPPQGSFTNSVDAVLLSGVSARVADLDAALAEMLDADDDSAGLAPSLSKTDLDSNRPSEQQRLKN